MVETLLKTDKVADKYKVQLRLAEKGMYPGLMCLIAEQSITMDMLGYMMDQVLSAGKTEPKITGYGVQFLHMVVNIFVGIHDDWEHIAEKS